MIHKLTRPVLLVDEDKAKANIRYMVEKAEKHNIKLSPHFKTHQSSDIGHWFMEEGVNSITVSSVRMASYFSSYGWKDITIGFPVNIHESETINRLAKDVDLTIFINNEEVAEAISAELSSPVKVFIEIDVGSQRTGICWDNTEQIKRVVKAVSNNSKLIFRGFYSHPGHSYTARSKGEIQSIHKDNLTKIKSVKENLTGVASKIELSLGDTPCCAVAEDFYGLDQITPGNFVFFDLMQNQIGSCNIKDIALALAVPVVDKNEKRKDIAIHGGAIHLSKEFMVENEKRIYGKPVWLENGKWSKPIEKCYLRSLSQEHGIISVTEDVFRKIKIGDWIGILPVHSCLTANLMNGYLTTEGKPLYHFNRSTA